MPDDDLLPLPPPGTLALPGLMTEVVHAPAGISDMREPTHELGFVLRPLDPHWASVGGAPPRGFPMRPGMGWVVPAGCEGFGEWRQRSIWLEMSIATDHPALVHAERAAGRAVEFRPAIELVDPILARLGLALHEGADPEDAVDRLYREAIGAALAAHLLRRYSNASELTRGRGGGIDDRRLRAAAAYIDGHLTDRSALSLAALAGVAGLSPHHFARAFARAFGAPPHRFVLERRLDRAEHLLRTTRLPIAEVASLAGFGSPSHLAARMRERRHRTPRAVRARATWTASSSRREAP